MIETSFKEKYWTVFDSGFIYCPYIPDITFKSNYSPVAKTGFKARKKEVEE